MQNSNIRQGPRIVGLKRNQRQARGKKILLVVHLQFFGSEEAVHLKNLVDENQARKSLLRRGLARITLLIELEGLGGKE